MLLNIKVVSVTLVSRISLAAGVFGVCLLEASTVCLLSRTAVASSSPSRSPSQSSFYHSIPAPPALLITRWYLPQNRLPSLACLCVNENDTMDLLYVSVPDK